MNKYGTYVVQVMTSPAICAGFVIGSAFVKQRLFDKKLSLTEVSADNDCIGMRSTGMNHDAYEDDHIARILSETKTIALVGASPNPARPSYRVMEFLLSAGYRVFPINPGHEGKEILGQHVFAKLADIPVPIDMVDVFRAAENLPSLVEEVILLTPRPKVVWGQLGVRHDDAAAKAEAYGIDVIMDRCPAIEHPRLKIS